MRPNVIQHTPGRGIHRHNVIQDAVVHPNVIHHTQRGWISLHDAWPGAVCLQIIGNTPSCRVRRCLPIRYGVVEADVVQRALRRRVERLGLGTGSRHNRRTLARDGAHRCIRARRW
jgi:hypothetical protein